MKLKQRFILYTMSIITISLIIGFLVSNIIYVMFVKDQVNERYITIVDEITEQMEQHEITFEASSKFLQTMSRLGYQIALVRQNGEQITYGVPFRQKNLNEEMKSLFHGSGTYNGVRDFKQSLLMMSHFSNDIENTVGTTVQLENEKYALFLRANNTNFFTEFHLIIFGFIFACFISSIVGILMLARNIIRSLTQLNNATQEIAKHNFDYPLEINGRDEFGQLAQSFRLMQKRLSHTEQARKKFVNNVSHDFQSPLLNIQGYSELLQREPLTDDGKKYNEIIQNEAKRLSNLTKQLLILTSIDEGTYPIRKQKVRIDEQLHNVVHSMLWRIEEKELEIAIDLQPISIYADRSLLLNAWENLIGNAIKYNKQYGEIVIRCFEDEHFAYVVIEDTGIGMDKETCSKVFERFYRADKARNKEGSGLGLAIVLEVLTYHEATITLESEQMKGSKFTVKLPKSNSL